MMKRTEFREASRGLINGVAESSLPVKLALDFNSRCLLLASNFLSSLGHNDRDESEAEALPESG
jgi:hypothetical protein